MNFYHEDCCFVEFSGYVDWEFAGILGHVCSFVEKPSNTVGWSSVEIFVADHVRRYKIWGWPFEEEQNLVD